MICITSIMLIKLLGVVSLVLISADALLHEWQYNFFCHVTYQITWLCSSFCYMTDELKCGFHTLEMHRDKN
jgi:hypothetical protein